MTQRVQISPTTGSREPRGAASVPQASSSASVKRKAVFLMIFKVFPALWSHYCIFREMSNLLFWTLGQNQNQNQSKHHPRQEKWSPSAPRTGVGWPTAHFFFLWRWTCTSANTCSHVLQHNMANGIKGTLKLVIRFLTNLSTCSTAGHFSSIRSYISLEFHDYITRPSHSVQ